MSNATSSADDVEVERLPLVIGVTGHLDLPADNFGKLKESVGEIFRQIGELYPDTPLVLLSSLAEGADRLVAEVFFEFAAEPRHLPLDHKLVVPMPMPQHLYEADFEKPGSLARFEELLNRRLDATDGGTKAKRFALPIIHGYSEHDIVQKDGKPRSMQYLLAGAYIARCSQILIALWDGFPPVKVGGTAHVVKFNLTGSFDDPGLESSLRQVREPFGLPDNPLDLLEAGPAYHVVAPRDAPSKLKTPACAKGERCSWHKDFPESAAGYSRRQDGQGSRDVRWMVQGSDKADAKAEAAYDQIYLRLNAFNRDAIRLKAKLKDQRARSRKDLFPDDGLRDLPDGIKRRLEHLRNCYAVADSLAIHFQIPMNRTLVGLFCAVFGAALSFHLYAHLHEAAAIPVWPFLLLYILFIAVAYSAYFWSGPISIPPKHLQLLLGALRARRLWARRGDYQNKRQDYRALAEGLRVQFFWHLAGLDYSVADHYLRKQKGELDWIRHAIRAQSILMRDDGESGDSKEDDLALRMIGEHWVSAQCEYFDGKAPGFKGAASRDESKKEKYERVVARLLWFATSLALLWLLPKGSPKVIALLVTLAVAGLQLDKYLLLCILLAGLVAFGLPEILHDPWEPWEHFAIIMLMGLPPVAAALFHNYIEKKALSEQAKQYGRMALIFSNASRRLGDLLKGQDYPAVRELLRELGKEALAENGDWVILHRERPLQVPHA